MLINHVSLEMREITCITSLGLMSCNQNNSIILPKIWLNPKPIALVGFPMSHKNGYKKGRVKFPTIFSHVSLGSMSQASVAAWTVSRGRGFQSSSSCKDLREVHAVMALVGA